MLRNILLRHILLRLLALVIFWAFFFALTHHANAATANQQAQTTVQSAASTQPTSLYMTYTLDPNRKYISWQTCGIVNNAQECFGSGNITPFGHICGIYSIGPYLFVADSASLLNGTPTSDTAVFVFYQYLATQNSGNIYLAQINLPVPADDKATCLMAATQHSLYFATNTSSAFAINLTSGQAHAVNSGFANTQSVLSMSSTQYGIILNYSISSSPPSTTSAIGTIVYGDDGGVLEAGGSGGESFVLNGTQFVP